MTKSKDWDGPLIEEHGIIGDLHTAALVGCDGGINFMCFPEFDSPTIFARLLDPEEGGTFQIAPTREGFAKHQLYLPDTNILLTRFLGDEGIVEIIDFMPVEETGPIHNVIRMVRCIHGEAHLMVRCDPRFDYGRAEHRVHRSGNEVVFEPKNEGLVAVRLHVPIEHEVRGGAVVAKVALRAEQQICFVLESATKDSPARQEDFAHQAFDETVRYWRKWVARGNYTGRWRETVDRSALTLKLMTSQRYGSIIAAPTFGLPEMPGGRRNWDYRYTWIRDAALALREFLRLGHTEEVDRFMKWLEHRIEESEDGELCPLYRMNGGEVDAEVELDFTGYMGSRPVRIGNDAGAQLQLDPYGPLFDALAIYEEKGGTIAFELWNHLRLVADWVCANWKRPDEGIWEVRGGRERFLHSRLMCWTALDRAGRIAEHRSVPAPLDRWRNVRDEIYENIHDTYWNESRKAFVQRIGHDQLDASALQMPEMGFVGGTDPRWIQTLRAIEEELREDALVWRYRQSDEDDDLDPLRAGEGCFTICSFWLVECLSRAGRLEEARLMFEKMLGYANHLGLYAEQLGHRGEHLGNFPQAFTHIGLLSAAMCLDDKLNEPGAVF